MNPPPRRLAYTHITQKNLWNLTRFFDDSTTKTSQEGFQETFYSVFVTSYISSLSCSLSSQSTKDVRGLNHWCCSSTMALRNMAEGLEGRASPLKGFEERDPVLYLCPPLFKIHGTYPCVWYAMYEPRHSLKPFRRHNGVKWHVHLMEVPLLGCNNRK